MRFDDSLKTVLAADTSTAFGARAAFRQLADLIARGRVSAEPDLLARLKELRASVPVEVRAAVARGLALADPPALLVALFTDDVPDVAGAVLRAARLDPSAWESLIPQVGPFGRSVLRRRDDLPPSAVRALVRAEVTDFALPGRTPEPAGDTHPAPRTAQAEERTDTPTPETPSQTGEVQLIDEADHPFRPHLAPAAERFEIADLVHRIEEFQRDRHVIAATPPPPVRAFAFETDAEGTIRWVDTAPRGAVIGLRLRHVPGDPAPVVDGVAAGAFRKRAPIANARLGIPGASALAGEWRLAAAPMFDPASGRFLGYRGNARRPHAEEVPARPAAGANRTQVEGLRRLVHELRTPTNAIAGFSELIEAQVLGPVPDQFRTRAGAIRRQVMALIVAIDDLELAARLDGDALTTRPEPVELEAVLGEALGELMPLVERRGCSVRIEASAEGPVAVRADDRATARLVSRLLATLIAASTGGEDLTVGLDRADDTVTLSITRPAALRGLSDEALLSLDTAGDGDGGDDDGDTPLLGIGFALRLARNLAGELGGQLAFGEHRLTLTLPAAFNNSMDHARSTNP